MHRALVTPADITDKGIRLLVNTTDIPEGLSQDVSDVFWVYICEAVPAGYIQIYTKKNLEELGFLT